MPRNGEETLSTETIYEGRTLTLHVDSVRLPDGNTAKREIVDHRGSVCIVALHEGSVYLVRQYRHAAGESLLELPAGTQNDGEGAEACAYREIREEIGFAADRMTFLFEGYVSPGYTGELQRYFLAEGLRPAPAEADDDEFLDVEPMPWAEALSRVARGEFRDTKTVAGLLCAARFLEGGNSR
jgi:ADP-ribose pyrophosphatase